MNAIELQEEARRLRMQEDFFGEVRLYEKNVEVYMSAPDPVREGLNRMTHRVSLARDAGMLGVHDADVLLLRIANLARLSPDPQPCEIINPVILYTDLDKFYANARRTPTHVHGVSLYVDAVRQCREHPAVIGGVLQVLSTSSLWDVRGACAYYKGYEVEKLPTAIFPHHIYACERLPCLPRFEV